MSPLTLEELCLILRIPFPTSYRKKRAQHVSGCLVRSTDRYLVYLPSRFPTSSLDDSIDLFAPEEAADSKHNQASRNAPEPVQIVDFLSRHFDVHAPHAADDVHGEHDGADDLGKEYSLA